MKEKKNNFRKALKMSMFSERGKGFGGLKFYFIFQR